MPCEQVFMDLPARFINHSCEANVGIRDNNAGAFDFLALQPVLRGEELTWVGACSRPAAACCS